MTRGAAPMDLRVRVPGWTAGPPGVTLNGVPLRNAVVPAGPAGTGGWVVVGRHWRPGDSLTVTLPMRLTFTQAADNPAVQAVSYGPVVLSGRYGASYVPPAWASGTALAPSAAAPTSTPAPGAGDGPPATALPVLDAASVRRATANPMTFEATAGAERVTLIPVARAQHKPYTVYWQT